LKYIEYKTEEAMHEIKMKSLPYKYDLNIYRGCTHECKYCYAYYSQKSLRDIGEASDIIVKSNIVEVLERELADPTWERKVVNIGGVCDSYQQCEANYKYMPDILRLMIKYKTPVIISTKSDLIL
jgi:DNA repair photolyase